MPRQPTRTPLGVLLQAPLQLAGQAVLLLKSPHKVLAETAGETNPVKASGETIRGKNSCISLRYFTHVLLIRSHYHIRGVLSPSKRRLNNPES